MSHDENKYKTEWCKHEFENGLKNKNEIEIQNGMTCINENKVNKLAQCNLLYDILNNSKLTKSLNSHYSHILQGYMNTQKNKATCFENCNTI